MTEVHDRECLVLFYDLSSFRHFLIGKEFDVQTDNIALVQSVCVFYYHLKTYCGLSSETMQSPE
jgi:hypothetical protein